MMFRSLQPTLYSLSVNINRRNKDNAVVSGEVSTSTMCCGQQRSLSKDNADAPHIRRSAAAGNESVVEDLRHRLAETEARLARARAREAELSRRLEEMKRFVSVMEILEGYLKRRFREQQELVARLLSVAPSI